LHYKIHLVRDHVAKFRGDRPRELGDPVAKEKKHLQQNIRPSELTFGRPNKQIFTAIYNTRNMGQSPT